MVFGEMPQPADDTVDGVITDDPSIPASIDHLVAGDDTTPSLHEDDQDLHHAGLKRLVLGSCDDLPGWRFDPDRTEAEWRLVRKHYATANGKSVEITLPHCLMYLTQVRARITGGLKAPGTRKSAIHRQSIRPRPFRRAGKFRMNSPVLAELGGGACGMWVW